MALDADLWAGRRVLVTGHTGFKGAWLTLWLRALGAEVTGFSVDVPTRPSLFELAGVGEGLVSVTGDVRSFEAVGAVMGEIRPEMVFHLAAQPLVRRSLREPLATYATNVMGTANVLEAVRVVGGVRVIVNVTSDKCYAEQDLGRGYRESDALGGSDPYSASKAGAEVVAAAHAKAFFRSPDGPRLASARAGNVIGGGDWGEDRLIPDLVRAAAAGRPLRVRNPDAVRPWQHVLNALGGYLELAEALWRSPAAVGAWNFGPEPEDTLPVHAVVDRLSGLWVREVEWEADPRAHPREAPHLALDSSAARRELRWVPRWGLERALEAVAEWHAGVDAGDDPREVSLRQIEAYAEAPAPVMASAPGPGS
jgi:CDP-glucose 4,6-dehydratase